MNAIILAGGKGSRLAPFVSPKPLLPIAGVSMLQRLMAHLDDHKSITDIVVCVGYRANDVKASIEAHGWFDRDNLRRADVVISNAGEEASMGVRLLKAQELFDGEQALIVYADELADVNIDRLLEAHKNNVMTFTVCNRIIPGGSVQNLGDRPLIIEDVLGLVNIGFVVVEPVCWKYLQPSDGVSGWINRVATFEKVGTYHHDGKRATVNALGDLKAAEEMWKL